MHALQLEMLGVETDGLSGLVSYPVGVLTESEMASSGPINHIYQTL